ncbi:hypothetical protein [Pikeienuella sp. HZG-20]|uniref:hypothetical protein n=1 Tax=Paludibacillus litoralis TaxID=3133267 RepID=UPI0030EC1BDD
MRALDSLAAAWGGMAIPGAPCDARYEVETLRARCADLAKDAEALRAGLAPLMALASATRGDALAEADERWLTAVDAVFAATAGRGLPEARAAGAAVAAADARLRALLARAAPGYGATGLEELMNPAGAPLSPEEAAALAPLVAEAERALAAWERAAAPAPAGAALAEYSAYLDARADAATGDE